jgi:hypothetical protein
VFRSTFADVTKENEFLCPASASSSKTTTAIPPLLPPSGSTGSKATWTPSTRSSRPWRHSRSRPYPTSSTLYSTKPKSGSWLGGKNRNEDDLPLRRNGKDRVRIKTLHGGFEFAEQRFLLPDGSSSRYLGQTNQSFISLRIKEFCLYFCNRLSFSEVVKLLERLTGERLLCEQTLWNWAQEKACEVGTDLRAEVAAAERLALPSITEAVDIYDASSEEVLALTDAIQVKAQKPTRQVARKKRRCVAGEPKRERKKKQKRKRIETDLMLLQGQNGSFRYLCGGSVGDEPVSLLEVARAHLRKEWGERTEALPVVAITDGARPIRLLLEELFGSSVVVILDWYHLSKKVYQQLSMVAHSKEERERMEGRVLALLWRGEVGETLSFLGGIEAPRKEEALSKLIKYLENHATEIIDYERRAKAGKWIGSGRMEKAVDQAVGMRQKKKGMSWSESGSRALALLKVVELNNEWERLWESTPAVA